VSLTGTASPPGRAPEEERWDLCEIVYERRFGALGDKYRFWARAMGPGGTYTAAENQDWIGSGPEYPTPNRKLQESLDDLVRRLISGGWEPTGRGHDWYGHRFRRRARGR
jgi:hypothetical protein